MLCKNGGSNKKADGSVYLSVKPSASILSNEIIAISSTATCCFRMLKRPPTWSAVCSTQRTTEFELYVNLVILRIMMIVNWSVNTATVNVTVETLNFVNFSF